MTQASYGTELQGHVISDSMDIPGIAVSTGEA